MKTKTKKRLFYQQKVCQSCGLFVGKMRKYHYCISSKSWMFGYVCFVLVLIFMFAIIGLKLGGY